MFQLCNANVSARALGVTTDERIATIARVTNLTAEWKRLSNEYSEARERFEAASSAVVARGVTYSTPTEQQLAAQRAARVALQTATRRLYDFLARSEVADGT